MATQTRFRASEQTSIKDLQATLRQMRATGLKIEQDYDTGDVAVRFDRSGSRYVFRNGRYRTPPENLRAIERTITYLYKAMEVYGTERQQTGNAADPFTTFFAGWAATPDDTSLLLGSGQWWDALGVSREATQEEIRNAFRALAKVHHPDAGGKSEDFIRLRKAYDEGMAATGG